MTASATFAAGRDYCLLITENVPENAKGLLYWWAPQGGGRGPFSELFSTFFEEKGLSVISDSSSVSINIHSLYHHPDLSEQEAVNLANLLQAKYVVLGHVRTEIIGQMDLPLLTGVRLTAIMELWDAKHNKKVASQTLYGTGFHSDTIGGIKDAFIDMTPFLMTFLHPSIAETQPSEIPSEDTNWIRIILQGVLDNQNLEAFKSEVATKLSSFPFILAELMPGMLVYKVAVPLGESQESHRATLRAIFISMPFEHFQVTVEEVDKQTLKLSYMPKLSPTLE